MSYIVRTGNLASTPELREGEYGSYTFARVIVSDRIRQEDGSYVSGPAIAYDVLVSGSQAVNLVDAAKASGNIRITFAGLYRVTEWRGDAGTRIEHEVRANEVSVSLLGQRVMVERPRGDVAPEENTPF